MTRSLAIVCLVLLAVVLPTALWFTTGEAGADAAGAPVAARPESSRAEASELTRHEQADPRAERGESGAGQGELEGAPEAEPDRIDAAREAEAAEWVTVNVLVRDLDGAPRAGAEVLLYARDGRSSPARQTRVRTNAEGRATFEAHANWELVVWAWSERRRSSAVDVPPIPAGGAYDVVIELQEMKTTVIQGVVVADEDGAPLADAVVLLRRADYWTRTSAGEHEIDVVRTAPVDGAGRFRFEYEIDGRLHVAVDAPGRSMVLLTGSLPDGVVSGEGAAALENVAEEPEREVRLKRAAALNARVHGRDGVGIGDVRVRLTSSGTHHVSRSRTVGSFTRGFSGDLASESVSDVTGLARFEGLAPEVPYTVELSERGEDWESRPGYLTLQPGEERELPLGLGAGASVLGRVVSGQGKRVGYAKVWLSPVAPVEIVTAPNGAVSIWTDGKGRFQFDDVEDGTWWLGTAGRSDRNSSRPERIVVTAGVAPGEVVLVAWRDLAIAGVVLNPDGEPAGATHVSARVTGIAAGVSAKVGEDGTFVLRPLVGGEHELYATGELRGFAPSTPVWAEAGEEDVVLRLRMGGEIRGRVLAGASGEPAPARVLAEPLGHGSGRSVYANEDGEFSLRGLEPGTYRLLCVAEDGTFAARTVVVPVGESLETCVLTLEVGGLLRLVNPSADASAHVEVRFQGQLIASRSIESGATTDLRVPAGRTAVTAGWAAGVWSDSREIDLESGEVFEFVVGEPR
jgi:hypothetical protein